MSQKGEPNSITPWESGGLKRRRVSSLQARDLTRAPAHRESRVEAQPTRAVISHASSLPFRKKKQWPTANSYANSCIKLTTLHRTQRDVLQGVLECACANMPTFTLCDAFDCNSMRILDIYSLIDLLN
jgi:hypothetical protein